MGTIKKRQKKRVKTPTVIQMEAVECGAAALGIVLGYFGRYVSLDELRLACGVSRDGSKASKMISAAKNYGLNGRGAMLKWEQSLSNPFPFIVFWERNHFVVVEGVKRSRIHLNDPAFGPRTVSKKEYEKSFSDICLFLDPGENFKPQWDKPGILSTLLPKLRGSWDTLIFALLISLTLIIPTLIYPSLAKIFIDDYLIKEKHDWIGPIITAMVLIELVHIVLRWLRKTFLIKLHFKLTIATNYQFMLHVESRFIFFYRKKDNCLGQ